MTVRLDAIVSELKRELSKVPNDDLDRAAYSYALFVLMTYERYSDIRHELYWIRESGLRWITELIEYYEQSVVVSQSVAVEVSVPSKEPYYMISVSEHNVVQSVEVRDT